MKEKYISCTSSTAKLLPINILEALLLISMLGVSFWPIIPSEGWGGAGPHGAYVYRGEKLYLKYNDPTAGFDKPHIFLIDGFNLVSVIEFSDHTSMIDGRIISGRFDKAEIVNNSLIVSYKVNGTIPLKKIVTPMKLGVEVTYITDKPRNMTLALWRWYYHSVANLSTPGSIPPNKSLDFSAYDGGNIYYGKIILSKTPLKIRVEGENGRPNKILMFFRDNEVSVKVLFKGEETYSLIRSAASLGFLRYPLIAVVGLASYLLWKTSYGRKYRFRFKIRAARRRD